MRDRGRYNASVSPETPPNPAWNARSDPESEISNPYVDSQRDDIPVEIARFALHTDPYANAVPRLNAVMGVDDADSDYHSRPSPWVVAVSLLLIGVLILPITFEVFVRLTH